jgi:serine/threonine protein kinase
MSQYFNEKDYPSAWYFLQPGTEIDEYVIERSLGGGGFSSVYLARQNDNLRYVVIKEYLPRRLAHRTWGNLVVPNSDETRNLFIMGRKLFLEEAKALTKFRHSSIVEVLNFFQANSTVYLVMVYEYGRILSDYLREKNGQMSEFFMMTVFPTLLEGIKCIHDHGFLHLDIKPHNILIRPGGDPLLLDFGAIQRYPHSGPPKPGKVSSTGFSPIEQYLDEALLGPWSDLYALGATMRMCIEGKPPPDAKLRVEKDTLVPAVKAFRKQYSPALLEAIDAATATSPKNRPQSAQEMIDLLRATQKP